MPAIRLFGCLSILTAAMSLSSCSTNISYDRDASIPVPAGATVAFAGGTSEGSESLDPAVGNDIVHRRVQTAIVTVPPVVFASASFVVDLVQRSTGNTAWRGTWRGDPGPRAPTQQEIDATMARIFRSMM